MHIAVLLECHKNADQVNRLIKALSDPEIDFFIHVDRKAVTLRNQLHCDSRVFLLPKEFSVDVRWGQFSQVKAILNLIKYANANKKFPYYWLMSGQDYPIKPIRYIKEVLGIGGG